MLKKYKPALIIFAILVLINLLFPPVIQKFESFSSTTSFNDYFHSIFKMTANRQINIPILIVLILISFIVSILIQLFVDYMNKDMVSERKEEK